MVAQDKLQDLPAKTVGGYLFGKPMPEKIVNKICLVEMSTGCQITFGQLEQQSHALAVGLFKEIDVSLQDNVAIFGESTIEFTVALSAALLLGVRYTLITPANGPYELSLELNDAQSRILFVDRARMPLVCQVRKQLKWVERIVVLDSKSTLDNFDQNLPTTGQLISLFNGKRLSSVPYFPTCLKSPVLVSYTSGSTGVPKGACHTHRSLLANLVHFPSSAALAEHRHSPVMLSLTLGHISGNVMLLASVAQHVTTVLLGHQSLKHMFDAIERYRVGRLYAAIDVMSYLVHAKHSPRDLSSLKLVMLGGSKFPPTLANMLIDHFGIHTVECNISDTSYGSTEFLYTSVSCNPNCAPENVGRILPSSEIKIVDLTTGEPLPPGHSGEILLRGPYCFSEYLYKPELTAQAIDAEEWYHTGDVGYLDSNYSLHLTDRIKEIIKFQGWTVFPAQIENFLATHPAVQCSVVVPVKHRHYCQVPRAYVTLNPGFEEVTSSLLEHYVKENLGYQRRLRGGIVVLNQMQYVGMGKIDRKHFKQLCAHLTLENLDVEE